MRFSVERSVAWHWLCKDKLRFWIFVGPLVTVACGVTIFSGPSGLLGEYDHLLPIGAVLAHVCPGRIFSRTPTSLFAMWLTTALLSMFALAAMLLDYMVG